MSLKKSLINLLDKTRRVKGQATLEYVLLFSVIVAATAMAVTKTGVLDRLQSSGVKVVDEATMQINEANSESRIFINNMASKLREEYEACRQKCYDDYSGQPAQDLQICYGGCEQYPH